MALNVYGKESWATKITSMLEDSYTQYDASDYDTAPANNEWIQHVYRQVRINYQSKLSCTKTENHECDE